MIEQEKTEIVKKAREYAILEIETYGFPIKPHFEISEKKAIELSKYFSGTDPFVIRIGACFMDLKLGQAIAEKRTPDHVAMSSKAASEFLRPYSLGDATLDKIINCIEAHHKTIPFSCKEAEVCANADCYRFLTPYGIFAYFTAVGKRDEGYAESLDLVSGKLEEKYNILSLDVCKKELWGYYRTFKDLLKKARETNQ